MRVGCLLLLFSLLLVPEACSPSNSTDNFNDFSETYNTWVRLIRGDAPNTIASGERSEWLLTKQRWKTFSRRMDNYYEGR